MKWLLLAAMAVVYSIAFMALGQDLSRGAKTITVIIAAVLIVMIAVALHYVD